MAELYKVSVKLAEDYCTIEDLSHTSGDEGQAAPVPPVRAERRVNLLMMMKIFCVLLVAGLVSFSVYYFIKLNHKEQELEELRNAIYKLTSNNSALHSKYIALNEKHDELTKELSDLKEFYCDATDTSPDKTCSVCKPDWVLFSSKCYFFSTSGLTWKESHDWCETRGGRLVNIESSDVLDFVTSTAKEHNYWIGGYDISKDNKSTRMDAGPVKSKRANDDDDEKCLTIRMEKKRVESFNCKQNDYWICEFAAFPLRI